MKNAPFVIKYNEVSQHLYLILLCYVFCSLYLYKTAATWRETSQICDVIGYDN